MSAKHASVEFGFLVAWSANVGVMQDFEEGTMQCVGQSLGLAAYNACMYNLRHAVFGIATDGENLVR